MRVAIIFSGFIENTDVFKSSSHFIDFMDRYQPDCYFSVWQENTGDTSPFRNVYVNSESFEDVHHTFESDSVQYHTLRSTGRHVFLHSYPEDLLYRLRSQYYHVQKAFNIIPNPDNYDVIIRMRSFLYFKKPFVIEDYNYFIKNNIPVCFSDWVVMGSPKVMRVYSNLYNSLYGTRNLVYPFSSFIEMYPVLYFAKNGYPSYINNSSDILPFEIRKQSFKDKIIL